MDIDNLLSLWGDGYKAFLDSNLAILLFFVGGISEMCFIAVFGEDRYRAEVQSFYNLFAANNREVEASFVGTPPYQRLQIFNQLGFVSGDLMFTNHEDINRISVEDE